MRWLYTALLLFLVPFQLVYLWRRGSKNPDYRAGWGERFGFGPTTTSISREDAGRRIWIHAVSVGEFEAARPLITALQKQDPSAEFLITTTTPTGAARVAEAGLHIDTCRMICRAR